MKKELIPKEEIEKLEKKEQKQLSLKDQLKKDILGYNQRIVNLTAQLNQVIGAKMEAKGVLKRLEMRGKEEKI